MSARWSKEDLAAAQARMAKAGVVRTHVIAGRKNSMLGVDIDAIHRKYGNKPFNGFPSKKEHDRYQELALLFQVGKIHDLKRQVPFDLVVKGFKICRYVADFVYVENGKTIVEDSKGYVTREFRIKSKLMKAIHGITIKLS